jgi:ribosomal protein L20A (L18A)
MEISFVQSTLTKRYTVIMVTKTRQESAIDTLLQDFADRNSFIRNIEALDAVTPNDWNKQLVKALDHLEQELKLALYSVEHHLHDGDFSK